MPGPPAPPPPPGGPPPRRRAVDRGSRRTTRRALLVAGVLLVVLLGGCAALVAIVVPRALEHVTAPVDVANAYLDAARSGASLAPFACRPDDPPHPEVLRSQGQYLNTVEVDGHSFAEVGGSLTLEDGFPARITVELRRGVGPWCVHDVAVDGS